MQDTFEQVKRFLLDQEILTVQEDVEKCLVVIEDEQRLISGMVIDVEPGIVVLEQTVLPPVPVGRFKRLLTMNRGLVHGAFAIDEESNNVVWRDTLASENLDQNELIASINAFTLGMTIFGDELLDMSAEEVD